MPLLAFESGEVKTCYNVELISKDHLVELGISLCVLLGQVDRVGDLLHCGKALLLQDILLIPGQHRF